MKRPRLFGAILALCASRRAFLIPGPSRKRPQEAHRAIMDFDYATVRTNAAAIFGTDIDVGKGITDMLVTNLVKDGTYSVIERKALDKVLAEQNFSNSERANPASAAKLRESFSGSTPLSWALSPSSAAITRAPPSAAQEVPLGGIGLGGIGRKGIHCGRGAGCANRQR